LWSNAGARVGDVLFLTKPIGTGVIATALKFERLLPAEASDAIESMRVLNRTSADVLGTLPGGAVHACTDVTGFGLVGHASEIAAASGVTVVIDSQRVPMFRAARAVALANTSRGATTNAQHFAASTRFGDAVEPDLRALFVDPQTSGGLLVSLDAEIESVAAERFAAAGVSTARIGHVERSLGHVRVDVRDAPGP
jgi:selenide,water dikinase